MRFAVLVDVRVELTDFEFRRGRYLHRAAIERKAGGFSFIGARINYPSGWG